VSVARGLLLSGLVWSWSCAGGQLDRARNEDTPATAWHYEIAVDAALTEVEAKLCFEGPTPRELRAGKDEAAGRLRHARWLGPGAVRKLRIERGRIQLLEGVRDGCLSYTVSLRDSGSLDAAVRHVGDDLIASPNVWLWRPERRAIEARATLSLRLPVGIEAMLPWPHAGDAYVLDAEAFRFDSYAAFGSFERVSGAQDDVRIEAALLDGARAIDAAAALRWLASAVRVASLSDGQFPRDRLSAIIVPSGESSEPVPFGMVARGGGASVLLLLSARAGEEELRRDWVLPHELGHLLLPFVEREQAWLSEGFATYYQEVLLARAGLCSEPLAWSRIARSMRSAESEDPGGRVVAADARGAATTSYRKQYWGGAAYWLAVDVALRKASRGQLGLDGVLHELRAVDRRRGVWTMSDLIAKLDQISGGQAFSHALSAASSREFPDYEQTLAQLGVTMRESEVVLDEQAELANVRRALMAQR
jgi:hypothetical protein